ncbi:hypothetical protein M413DRAFT_450159, partial [Hebeloma cylindrosporum]
LNLPFSTSVLSPSDSPTTALLIDFGCDTTNLLRTRRQFTFILGLKPRTTGEAYHDYEVAKP